MINAGGYDADSSICTLRFSCSCPFKKSKLASRPIFTPKSFVGNCLWLKETALSEAEVNKNGNELANPAKPQAKLAA